MKLWKKAMVLALCVSMSVFAASCSFGQLQSSDDSSTVDTGSSTAPLEESTPGESTPDESTPGGETPGGDETPEVEKYTIKFVNTDGTVISEAEYEEGATVVVPADLDPIEADGYRYAFAGWGEVSATAVADATYTAVFSVEGVAIEYTISFNHPKTGMPLAAPITFTVETMSSIVFPEVPADLAPEGYQAAWDKTVADVTLADLQVVPVLTAIEYQATFVHPKTGMPIAEPITYTVENMYDVVFPAIPEGYQMPGYTMTWDKTPADLQVGGTVVSLGTPVANTYAIIYKMGDGSETQQVVYDSEFTLLVPTREGYNFEGWYIVKEGVVTDEKLEEGIWTIDGNVVVEAKWSFPEGEYAMKYVFNESSETVSQVTKKAYEGGSTVSFQYYIPAGTPTSWWGLSWSTVNTGLDIYAAASASTAKVISAESTITGAWTKIEFTLPEGGPYYLYFGSEVGAAHGRWQIDGVNSYVLIDEFTVDGEVETFNKGIEDSAFEVLYPSAVGIGEGWISPFPGEFGAKIYAKKISSTKTTPTFITKQTYTFTETTTVSFDYFMAGNTAEHWWSLCWTSDQKQASIYAHAENNVNYGKELPKTIHNTWTTVSVEIPAGTWYLYIALNKPDWAEGSYVIIDNFKIGDQVTEEFSYGMGESIFAVSPFSSHHSAVELVDGYIAPAPVPQGVKIQINNISEKGQSFVTSSSYAGGGTITFDYYMYNPANNWWSICWSESKSANNTSTTIYAHTGSYVGCGGKELPKVQGSWETVTVEVPEGNWYFYIGGAKGSWSDGYVILDNVVIKDASGKVLATENFDNGYGIFENRRTSDIFLVEGKPADVEPEVPEVPENPLGETQDQYALVNLMKKGKITEYLNDGGYASIFCNFGGELSMENIPASMLYMEGYISYLMNGEKEFAIYFGNGAFIFVNGSIVAFCDGNEMVKYVAATDVTKLAFTITAGGKLNVKMNNGAYVGMGMLDAASISGIKLIALGGAGSVTFTDIEIEAYKCLAVDVPVYHSEEGIDITAFAFDSDPMISDAGFQLMKDAGFTKTLGLLQGRPTVCGNQNLSSGTCETCGSIEAHLITLMNRVNADAIAALELAEKYGLKHYVMNVSMYTIIKNPGNANYLDEMAALTPGGAENPYGAVDMDGITKDLSDAFAGFYLGDEPSTSQLTKLANSYKAFKAAFPNSDAYINLYPCDTSFVNVSDYEAYIDTYIRNIALDTKDSNGNVIPGTGYVCFDHYPLTTSGITSKHLYNLELVAEKCRDNNLELRFYVKAAEKAAEATKRSTESINDLYMQLYSGLAYGGKEICYYQFTNGGAAEGDGLIGKTDLTTGKVYNWAKQANNEIHAFEKAYMNFTWKSASVFGKTSITQFNNLKNKASAYGYISSVSTASSVSVLIGNFDDADGKYTFGAKNAYMVVNYGNTGSSQAASDITITFNGTPKRAIVYQQGEMEVVTLNGNNLTLNLMLGEGAFVIPLTNAR